MQNINVVLFEDFTLLDAIGPIEVFSRLSDRYRIRYVSADGGTRRFASEISFDTRLLRDVEPGGILLIPGGMGTRELVNDGDFIAELRSAAEISEFVLTVCTGSALLAKTGLLKNRAAPSNKLAFDWVRSQDETVGWHRKTRWIADGKYYSSSGVSAGMDMALGFVSDVISPETADTVSRTMEYVRNADSGLDPFAV